MPPPRLSVVVPTHDTRELTLRCLETVLAAGTECEVVLVDDGSRDGTAEAVARRFPTVRILSAPGGAEGFTLAANRGVAAAGAPVVLLLNSDTEVPPGGFERLLAAFAADPRLGVAGAQLHYPDGSPQWSGGRAPTLAWLFVLASGLGPLLGRLRPYRAARPLDTAAPRALDWVTGAALAFRREVWEAAGPLDPDLRLYAQDLAFCLGAGRAGWKVEVRPELRVLHHHGASIGRTEGAFRRQNHALLWRDLLTWARKDRGLPWARRAAAALRWGARLRLLGRALSAPFLPAAARDSHRRESAALRGAVAALPLAFPAAGG